MNLHGAQGILVNVTGANMTLGEFQDIGSVINGFASEDATVVMGTAIDESLEGEIRVTVVATGLGHPSASQQNAQAATRQSPSIKVVKPEPVEPEVLDVVETRTQPARQPAEEAVTADGGYDEKLLDIPAFLRRQAD